MKKLYFLVILVLVSFAHSLSPAKELPKVAVWDLEARETKSTHAQELTSILVSEIIKMGKYEVYSREELRTVAGWTEEKMKLGCTNTQCLTALGQMDISKLISGSVGKIGDRYSISLKLFDTQKTRAENAISEFCSSENELIELVQFGIRKLLGDQTAVAPTQKVTASISKVSEIGRDGRFIAYDNGTVLDTRTNLIWAAKDNGSDINWNNAKSYCENYRGGGYTDWRMPTRDELSSLYDESVQGKNGFHLTNLITLTESSPWASERQGLLAADFEFKYGIQYWSSHDISGLFRALPVRSNSKIPEKKAAPTTLTESVPDIEMILVKGGCYQMGESEWFLNPRNDQPVHEVCLDDFYLGKYEVTQGQWKAIMGNNPSRFKSGDNYPVEQVSWNDAQEFIKRMNQLSGKKYRLPTEAEWEYAARSGGKEERYAGTNDDSELGAYTWYSGNSGNKTHPVGEKRPNGLGLYDMSGNVLEWSQDWFDGKYFKNSPTQNPSGPSSGYDRVIRGGCWGTPLPGLRTTTRFSSNVVAGGATLGRDSCVGFRLAGSK